jgi:hypothetical protein
MCVLGAAVVVSFEPAPGTTLAAVWDGGQWCQIHVVESGNYGPVLEVWDMHNEWHGGPEIECTPAALKRLVEFRLRDTVSVAELASWATSYCDRQHRRTFAPTGAPRFSLN